MERVTVAMLDGRGALSWPTVAGALVATEFGEADQPGVREGLGELVGGGLEVFARMPGGLAAVCCDVPRWEPNVVGRRVLAELGVRPVLREVRGPLVFVDVGGAAVVSVRGEAEQAVRRAYRRVMAEGPWGFG